MSNQLAFKQYAASWCDRRDNHIAHYQEVGGTAWQKMAFKAIELFSKGHQEIVIHTNINHPSSYELQKLVSDLNLLTGKKVELVFHRLRRGQWVISQK